MVATPCYQGVAAIMVSRADVTELKAAFLAVLNEVGSVRPAARELGINVNTAYGWARQAGIRSIRRARAPPPGPLDLYGPARRGGVAACGRPAGRDPCSHRTGLGSWCAAIPQLPVLSRWPSGQLRDGADDDGVHDEPISGIGAGGAGAASPVSLPGGAGTDCGSAAGRAVVASNWSCPGPECVDDQAGDRPECHGQRALPAAYRPPACRDAPATAQGRQAGRRGGAPDLGGGAVAGAVVTRTDQPDPACGLSG